MFYLKRGNIFFVSILPNLFLVILSFIIHHKNLPVACLVTWDNVCREEDSSLAVLKDCPLHVSSAAKGHHQHTTHMDD